jgi:hypothetical protein
MCYFAQATEQGLPRTRFTHRIRSDGKFAKRPGGWYSFSRVLIAVPRGGRARCTGGLTNRCQALIGAALSVVRPVPSVSWPPLDAAIG